MIVRLDAVDEGAELDADVCIVGAGAAGITSALQFVGTGVRVILVESGESKVEEAFEELNDGELAAPFAGLRGGRRRGFGGTTAAWGGQCCELSPADFDVRPWVPHSGWPITQPELEPFYRRAEHVFGVAGERYDDSNWKRFGIRPIRYDQTRLATSFAVFSPHPRLGPHYRRTFAKARNIRVILGATATAIRLTDDAARVKAIDVRSLAGRTGRITARAFVLCTGAIETARLLLVSRDVARAGVGNDRDLVGRYFQDHPTGDTAIVAPVTSRVQNAYSLLYRGRTWYWPKMEITPELQRQTRSLNAMACIMFEYNSPAIEALREMVRTTRTGGRFMFSRAQLGALARGAPAVADAGFRKYLLGRSPRATPARIKLLCTIEQAPNPDSRIILARTRDRLGMQHVCVDWKLTAAERHTFRVLTSTVASEFTRLGLGEIRSEPWLAGDDPAAWAVWDNYHQTGTARMSADPAQGVVDPTGQVHGVAGLYIAGAPTFPTSGYANPVLTISALSIRLTDHLKSTLFRN